MRRNFAKCLFVIEMENLERETVRFSEEDRNSTKFSERVPVKKINFYDATIENVGTNLR